jgi:hypothetical protein
VGNIQQDLANKKLYLNAELIKLKTLYKQKLMMSSQKKWGQKI